MAEKKTLTPAEKAAKRAAYRQIMDEAKNKPKLTAAQKAAAAKRAAARKAASRAAYESSGAAKQVGAAKKKVKSNNKPASSTLKKPRGNTRAMTGPAKGSGTGNKAKLLQQLRIKRQRQMRKTGGK